MSNHKDTLIIIATLITVQVAIQGFVWVSLSSRMDRIEARLDRMETTFHALFREHGERLSRLEAHP